MVTISNICIEESKTRARLVCDINSDIDGNILSFNEKQIWFEVPIENKDMLNTRVYDPFFLVPLYLAMYLKEDLKICGKMSKKLYFNTMNYIQQIFCNFSDDLQKINIEVEGFDVVEHDDKNLIGTGISCGVDSLSTIYDHFQSETDKDYRINSLFIFNCGTHGDFENAKTEKIYEARYRLNKGAADEIGLPVYTVNSNLHEFTHRIGEQKMGYIAIYSCILTLQRSIVKYYVSSTYGYDSIMRFGFQSHDYDMAEYAESYLIPLIKTESLELISDGCQYKRSIKTQRIADWPLAHKYLNVCVNTDENAHNCSRCSKCMRTLIVLDVMGKLDKFGEVFKLDVYYKEKEKNLMRVASQYGEEGFSTDIYDYANENGIQLPTKEEAKRYILRQSKVPIKRKLMEHYWNFREFLGKIRRRVFNIND